MGINSNLSIHVLCVCNSDEGKAAGNVVQAYSSGILGNKDGSVAILSDNCTEFKNTV